MLDAARVLMGGRPLGGQLGIEGAILLVRREEAEPVPRRIDKGVHRIGLALGGAAAVRAGGVQKTRVVFQRRLAGGHEGDVGGQDDRQFLFFFGYQAAAVAVEKGDRRAPAALPGDEPVAQPVGNGAFA